MHRPEGEAPEYRALLLGLLLVLGVLLWPAESSRDAEAPRTATAVQADAAETGTWPEAVSPASVAPTAPAPAERPVVGED